MEQKKYMMMCTGKCCGGCRMHKTCKALLYIGGLNWGLVGVGMLLGSDWNVIHTLLGSWAKLEAIIYVLVGVSAVMKLIGCRCNKCMGSCGSCGDGMMGNTDKKM